MSRIISKHKSVGETEAELAARKEQCEKAEREAKKMIVNSMIKRVDVYRNYELNVELNMNIRQFFLGMEETENCPITA